MAVDLAEVNEAIRFEQKASARNRAEAFCSERTLPYLARMHPTRIIGFDLARAYAIFGMLIVNFNFCFGSLYDRSGLWGFVNMFTGNSTAIFIICAGMGLSMMRLRHDAEDPAARKRLHRMVNRRAWYLFALGLALYSWWPGDILHFYGGYMHIAAFLLFVRPRYYLFAAVLAIVVWHGLLLVMPVDTGWDLRTFDYQDFWTVEGFLRNTLYNGWNSIFPWIAYFFLGMWLGHQDWRNRRFRQGLFGVAAVVFVAMELLRKYALAQQFDRPVMDYIMSDYFPPFLPFMLLTASFALLMISVCMWIGDRCAEWRLVGWLSTTGRMTLSNYVLHLTLGILVLQAWVGQPYTGLVQAKAHLSAAHILLYAAGVFTVLVVFNVLWARRFKLGPLEWLMRRLCG